MTLDHIGAFLFPQYIILRIIGRFTMPVFSYGVATGIINTKNPGKYHLRLLIFAVISQIPFELAGGSGYNIIVTIFVTALFLWLIRQKKPFFYLLSLIPFAASIFIPMDYGVYFLLLSTIIYLLYDRMLAAFVLGSLLSVTAAVFWYNTPLQIFSIAGLIFACFGQSGYIGDLLPKIHLNKYFFYIYYPVHFMVIYFLKSIALHFRL
jgi:hypothetical protein